MNERRTQDRRHISPAIAEYSALECARLREQVKELREALQKAELALGEAEIPFLFSTYEMIRAALAKANQ